jgi:simple sugar transport system ATP-binding protein
MDDKATIVEMRNIRKRFGPVAALNGVDLRLMRGEVLGLVGDNAAGKSTLMKILSGAHQRDEGEVLIEGIPRYYRGPRESRLDGIEMIYQDLALCGNLDVAQNIFLGRWPMCGLFVDRKHMYIRAQQAMQALGVDIDSMRRNVGSLSGGVQQSVSIARAILFSPKVLILDEPTANLSTSAATQLLEIMKKLKTEGIAQIVISHRLSDIFEVADRVMVLKGGRNAGSREVPLSSEKEVLELIISGGQPPPDVTGR